MTHRNFQDWRRVANRNEMMDKMSNVMIERIIDHTDYFFVRYLKSIKHTEAKGVFILIFCGIFNISAFFRADPEELKIRTEIATYRVKELIDTFMKANVNLDFLLDRKFPLLCLEQKEEQGVTTLEEAKNQYKIMKIYEDNIIPYISTKYKDLYRMPQVPLEIRQKIQSFVTGAGTLKEPRMSFKSKKKSKKGSKRSKGKNKNKKSK